MGVVGESARWGLDGAAEAETQLCRLQAVTQGETLMSVSLGLPTVTW